MIMYKTYSKDGYVRLHETFSLTNMKRSSWIKCEVVFITEKTLNKKFQYFKTFNWWRAIENDKHYNF